MNSKKQLTIKEFSRLTGIKPENLRFYDRIGLLRPETRGNNKYRYYSRRQLDMAYLIISLRGLGVGIEDIKGYAACPTPENTLALFARQQISIAEEMRKLREMESIMHIHAAMIEEAFVRGTHALFLEERAEESVFLCPPPPEGMDEEESSLFAYDYAEANGVNLGFPCGTFVADGILDPASYNQLYFKVGCSGNHCKPAGLYAVAYGICDMWETAPVYRRLYSFVKKQGLHICGDAYEEYPFGDFAVQGNTPCCVRVELPVTPGSS